MNIVLCSGVFTSCSVEKKTEVIPGCLAVENRV